MEEIHRIRKTDKKIDLTWSNSTEVLFGREIRKKEKTVHRKRIDKIIKHLRHIIWIIVIIHFFLRCDIYPTSQQIFLQLTTCLSLSEWPFHHRFYPIVIM